MYGFYEFVKDFYFASSSKIIAHRAVTGSEGEGRGSSVICGRVTGRKSMLLCKVATTQSPEREAGIKRQTKPI